MTWRFFVPIFSEGFAPDHDRIFPTNSDVLIAAINRLKGTILTRHFRIDLLETLVVKYSALIERKSLGNNKRTKTRGDKTKLQTKKAFINFSRRNKKEDSISQKCTLLSGFFYCEKFSYP